MGERLTADELAAARRVADQARTVVAAHDSVIGPRAEPSVDGWQAMYTAMLALAELLAAYDAPGDEGSDG